MSSCWYNRLWNRSERMSHCTIWILQSWRKRIWEHLYYIIFFLPGRRQLLSVCCFRVRKNILVISPPTHNQGKKNSTSSDGSASQNDHNHHNGIWGGVGGGLISLWIIHYRRIAASYITQKYRIWLITILMSRMAPEEAEKTTATETAEEVEEAAHYLTSGTIVSSSNGIHRLG